jgi:hypothetical protein
MIAALLAMALQGAAPPPPVVLRGLQPEALRAVSWTCRLRRRDGSELTVTGAFPAVSVEAQKNGESYRLKATIDSPDAPGFKGTYHAAMTNALLGMASYSIAVGEAGASAIEQVMTFQFFSASHDGFVAILKEHGAQTAYAAGLCETRDQQ